MTTTMRRPVVGRRTRVRFTIADCPLGRLLLAATERGLRVLHFGERDAALEAGLAAICPNAAIERADEQLKSWFGEVLGHLNGTKPRLDLPLDVPGTPFQRRVWDELRSIPYGETRTYREVAEAVGRPKAVRAVARACATNPVAVIVPCHRVIRSDGSLGGYAGGLHRKKELLDREHRYARASSTV